MKNSIMILVCLFISFCVFSQGTEQKDILKDPERLKKALAENNVWGKKILIGYGKEDSLKQKKEIFAYYYNKGGSEKAMIIAGVHGSEFYGVDVINSLKDKLDRLHKKNDSKFKFKWKVLIIPEVFPDNVAKGKDHAYRYKKDSIYYIRDNRFIINAGRETGCKSCGDPNRQMPEAGKLYVIGDSLSFRNNKIERENQYLLWITQEFDPSRIASLHCKNGGTAKWLKNEYNDWENYKEIGIYTDPKTDSNHKALGFSDDAILPIKMALAVKENGGVIFGNFVDEKFIKDNEGNFKIEKVSYLNAIYPQDSFAASKGEDQHRSFQDTDKNTGKPKGVTYGTWASTEIRGGKKTKKAANVLTVELPQYYYFCKEKNAETLDKAAKNKNTEAYAKALIDIFLENK